MKLCQSIMDMDMPDYVDSLDSSYTMLEFDNLRVLPNNTGEIFIRFLLNKLHYFVIKLVAEEKLVGGMRQRVEGVIFKQLICQPLLHLWLCLG